MVLTPLESWVALVLFVVALVAAFFAIALAIEVSWVYFIEWQYRRAVKRLYRDIKARMDYIDNLRRNEK